MGLVLVTGATGGLGRSLVPLLSSRGIELRLASRSLEKLEAVFGREKRGVEFAEFGLEKKGGLGEVVEGADKIIHLAAMMTPYYVLNPKPFSAARVMELNFRATARLVQAAKKAGAERIVFSSSCSVYAKNHDSRVQGASPAPCDVYGLSKLAAEEAVKKSGLGFGILRLARIYGKNFPSAFEASLASLTNGSLVLPNRGGNIMAFVHQNDAARAVLAALESGNNGIADVAGPEKIAEKRFFGMVSRHFNFPLPKISNEGGGPEGIALSNKEAFRLFGWAPHERLSGHLDEIIPAGNFH